MSRGNLRGLPGITETHERAHTMWGRKLIAAAALAGCSALAGCGDGEDPIDPVVGPPDLTGSYTLLSFNSTLATGGITLEPPEVTGSVTIRQTSTTSTEARGTLSMDVVVPDGLGGTSQFLDEGSYVARSNGTWEQDGTLVQARGTYTIEGGGVLTIDVTEPALSVSTSVWRRQ